MKNKTSELECLNCKFYHINDINVTHSTDKYYRMHLKDKFEFNLNELKRTQFCLNLANELTENDKNASIADLGPGRRLFTGLISQDNYKMVSAIDFKYYSGCDIENKNYQFIQSSIQDISEIFDYTFCFEVLEHNDISQLENLINKIKSISQKKAVISMPYYEDPVKTKDHFFTLNTEIINKYFSDSDIYLLYRNSGFPYIFFVFDFTR